MVYGEIVYLKDSGLVKGTDILGTPYPYTMIITNYGIQVIVKAISDFVDFLKQEGNEVDYNQITNITNFSSRLKETDRIIREKSNVLKNFLRGYNQF